MCYDIVKTVTFLGLFIQLIGIFLQRIHKLEDIVVKNLSSFQCLLVHYLVNVIT